MMWGVNLSVACCLCMLVLADPCCCDPIVGPEVSLIKPERPNRFASPQELRMFLDQLGEYYAVVGRPRFGKR